MEIRNIVTFVKATEMQSFTKTAAQLGYSQAAVTVQIKQLEDELGNRSKCKADPFRRKVHAICTAAAEIGGRGGVVHEGRR